MHDEEPTLFISFTKENEAIVEALKILDMHLNSFPTTIDEDEKLLKDATGRRLKQAIAFRVQMKNLYVHQGYLLRMAYEINNRMVCCEESEDEQHIRDMVLTRTTMESGCDDFTVLLNRRMMRGYYKRCGIELLQ